MAPFRRIALAVAVVAAAGSSALVQRPSTATEGDGVPSNYRCSASNQQTWDPISPPCIPFFDGDNGGATAPGVTADEVRIVLYLDGGRILTRRNGTQERIPSNRTYDLAQPPAADEDEPSPVIVARAYQSYFNQRFQTYGRKVRFFVYFNDLYEARAPEVVRSDVALLLDQVDPFAFVDGSADADSTALTTAVAQAGRLAFSDRALNSAALARSYPGLVWDHQPSDEQSAQLFSAYVCEQIVGGRTPAGEPRRLGLVANTDPKLPGLAAMAALVEAQVESCGGSFAGETASARHAFAWDTAQPVNPDAAAAMAEFQAVGVNTIIAPGGYDPDFSRAATARGYRPQWVTAGDGMSEGQYPSSFQSPAAWDGAISVAANHTPVPLAQDLCTRAVREVSQSVPLEDIERSCRMYVQLRQLFIGIQVAGPTLTAANLDTGMHALPARASTSPGSPACWYAPGDYTCVKDVAVGQWDAAAPPAKPGGPPLALTPGCWRLTGGGLRYQAGAFPSDAQLALDRRSGVCSTYSASIWVQLL